MSKLIYKKKGANKLYFGVIVNKYRGFLLILVQSPKIMHYFAK